MLFALFLLACPHPAPLPSHEAAFSWTSAELARLEVAELAVVERGDEVLRRRARELPPGLDLGDLAQRMEAAMDVEGGVGIAAPQVGLSVRAAVLELGWRTDDPHRIFAINPIIDLRADEPLPSWEGCLSVPDAGGMVLRSSWVEWSYTDLGGERVHLRSEGPDAVLVQHELDHLDGVLYVDRLVSDLVSVDEMRQRRRWLERPEPWVLVGDQVDDGATPLLEGLEGEVLPLDGPLPPTGDVILGAEQRLRSARGHAAGLLEGDPSRDIVIIGIAGDPEDEAVLAWVRAEQPERLRLAVLLGDSTDNREDALVAESWEDVAFSLVEVGMVSLEVLRGY